MKKSTREWLEAEHRYGGQHVGASMYARDALDSDAAFRAELRQLKKMTRLALGALDQRKGRPDLPACRLALVVALQKPRRAKGKR